MHYHRLILALCMVMSMGLLNAQDETHSEKRNVPIVTSSDFVPELSYEIEPDEVDFFLEEIQPEKQSSMQVWIKNKGARLVVFYMACKQGIKERYYAVFNAVVEKLMLLWKKND